MDVPRCSLLEVRHFAQHRLDAGREFVRRVFGQRARNPVQVSVKDALRKLTQEGRLTRDRRRGRYLYCAKDPTVQGQQLRSRSQSEEAGDWVSQPVSEAILPDEVRAAVLLFHSLLDEQQRRLYAGLEALKWGHGGDRKVARLLGLDVGTVAKGRQQLLQGEVLRDRIRKPGAGHPAVEKKRRR